MLIYELENPKEIRLITVLDQLQTDISHGEIESDWTVDRLLSYLQDFGLNMSDSTLRNLVKNKPVSNYIRNIQGDKVIFAGEEGTEPNPDQDQSQAVVKQMAQAAMK